MINLPDMKYNKNGTRKVWRTDNVETYCASIIPALLVWEKSTKYNGYNAYSGYVESKAVRLI